MQKYTGIPPLGSGRWLGFEVLGVSPVGNRAEDLALYSELWSKLRWALGSTFQTEYGKRSVHGELARRLSLLALANRNGPALI